jgi:hypothetical protein
MYLPGNPAPNRPLPDRERLVAEVRYDGRVIQSADPLNGGPPYDVGQVDPASVQAAVAEVTALLSGFEGRCEYYGVDAPFTQIEVTPAEGAPRTLRSWHEFFQDPDTVDTQYGLVPVNRGEEREYVLKTRSAEYLRFLETWSAVRHRVATLGD